MNKTKNDFIELCLKANVLQFGEFTLKSGRQSPYFFNAGLFDDGQAMQQLGQFYAQLIMQQQLDFDHIFGPAYKGIPLATATAIALSQQGINKTVSFNRKEIKDHGEGGQLIGAALQGRTLVIDDVMTAGTAFREAKHIIEQHGGCVSDVIIALDRCEQGQGHQSAVEETRAQGIGVHTIITIFDLIDYLEQHQQPQQAEQIRAYLQGVV